MSDQITSFSKLDGRLVDAVTSSDDYGYLLVSVREKHRTLQAAKRDYQDSVRDAQARFSFTAIAAEIGVPASTVWRQAQKKEAQ